MIQKVLTKKSYESLGYTLKGWGWGGQSCLPPCSLFSSNLIPFPLLLERVSLYLHKIIDLVEHFPTLTITISFTSFVATLLSML